MQHCLLSCVRVSRSDSLIIYNDDLLTHKSSVLPVQVGKKTHFALFDEAGAEEQSVTSVLGIKVVLG